MPELTYSEALAELSAMTDPTVEQLRDLVARTSVAQIDLSVPTKATVLYSGPLASNFHMDGTALKSGDVAAAMATADPSLKIIDNTHVGNLLLDPAFENKLLSAPGGQDALDNLLFKPAGGFWSNASERFAAAAADGDILVIAPKPSSLGAGLSLDGGIFSQNELRTLLEGDGTGRINGIELSALRERYSAIGIADDVAALKDATELLSVKSMSDLWSNLEVGLDGNSVTVRVDADLFADIGLSSVGEVRSSGFSSASAWAGNALFATDGMFNDLDMARVISKATTLKALATAGKIAGPVGDFIELAALTGTVVGLLNAGDRDGAARAAATGLASITGGALAASAAAAWAAPLLAGGPVGWVAYTIIVVGAGVAGSETGQYVADKAYTYFTKTLPDYYNRTGFAPVVWLADGLGAYHNFITVTLPDGLEYAARVTKELINGEIDIFKFFAPENEDIVQGEIIVTANRRTGETSYSFTGDWSSLQNQNEVGQAFAAYLLDYARSGQDLSFGTSGSSGSGASLSSLSAAQSSSGLAGHQTAGTPVLRKNADGTVTIGSVTYRPRATDGNNGFQLEEADGSLLDGRIIDVGGIQQFAPSLRRSFNGSLIVSTEYNADGSVKNTSLRFSNSPQMVSFTDAGAALGSTLGYRLAAGNELAGVLYSATLKTLGENLGEVVDAVIFGAPKKIGDNVDAALKDVGQEFLSNLKSAGIGAVSSFLTAELVNAIGLDGFAGQLANTASGAVIGQVLTNIADGAALFDGVNLTMVGNAIGSFVGSFLASKVISFDTIGGQIGSAVGAALAPIGVNALLAPAGLVLTPIGFAVVAFVGFILGGLIGSIFGGTPRSGADSAWDSEQQKFVVANVWSRKGGSKDAARSVASAVSDTFNSVLAVAGGTLLNPEAVQSGNYGMRKKAFVYKPYSTQNSSAITQKFTGKDAATRLIGYGVYTGLTDPDFQIAGGDTYVKRALYNTFQLGGLDPLNFDSSVLLGNISSAQQYESYLANSTVINALVAAEPDSVFTAETLLTLARADELGLTRRAASDWFGGFTFLLKEAQTNAAGVDFGFDYDPASGQVSRLIGVGNYVLGDTIDIAGQTTIEADSTSDTIDLRSGKLADQRGFTVNGHLNNDIAASGTDFTATTATLTFAASALRTSVQVNVAADGLAESTETFLASLSNAPGMQIMGGDAVATVIDGSTALPTLMVGDSYAWEGDGYAVFRLSLSKASASAITVSLSLLADRASGGGGDFGSGDASNLQVSSDGVSWTNATSATFAAGATQLFVRTAVIADNVANPDYVAPVIFNGQVTTPGNGKPQYLNIEGNERFKLQASVTAGAWALANGAQTVSGTGTIVDGAGSEPLVWIDNVVVDEAPGQATFTVSRSHTMSASTSVDFATSDRRVLDIPVAATVDGGDGNDTIYASNLGDNLFGGAGNDTLYGGRLDDWLLGGDGDDVLDAGTADQNALGGDGNYLDGGAGNDILRGREGSDWLDGGDGTDTLTGGAGDDILAGGAGDGDSLKGGLDNDQYLVRLGDGADIAEDEANGAPIAAQGGGDYVSQRMAGLLAGTIARNWIGNAPGVVQKAAIGGEDAIVFGQGIGLGDIQLVRSSTDTDDLIVRVMQTVNGVTSFTGIQLTVKDWFSDYFKRLEWLKFTDGTEVRIGDVTSFIAGGAGNDVLIGTSGNDFVYGGDGDDQLQLLGGDDTGLGGTGNDLVAGHSGQDLLVGGLGNDQLVGGKGKDALSGDAGGDDLYGGNDDDILSGGRGDGDVVVGGGGNDTFKYSRGDGRDEYFDDYSAHWDVVWTQAGQWNEAAGYHYNAATGEVTGPGGVYLRKNIGTAAEPSLQWLGRFDYDDTTGTLKVFNPPAGAAITANNGTDTIEFAPNINIQDIVLSWRIGTQDLVLNVTDENSEFTSASSLTDSITIKDWYAALARSKNWPSTRLVSSTSARARSI